MAQQHTPDEKQREKEAQGKGDGVQLTNGSGEVKVVSKEEWGDSDRQTKLLDEGWVEIGGDK